MDTKNVAPDRKTRLLETLYFIENHKDHSYNFGYLQTKLLEEIEMEMVHWNDPKLNLYLHALLHIKNEKVSEYLNAKKSEKGTIFRNFVFYFESDVRETLYRDYGISRQALVQPH